MNSNYFLELKSQMQCPAKSAKSFDSSAFAGNRRHCRKVCGDGTGREYFPSGLDIYGMSVMPQGSHRYLSHLILSSTYKIVIILPLQTQSLS